MLAGSTINAIFAFGEEVGWRGWLQHELSPLGFWRASLVGGVLWGIWHAPLILLAGHNFEKHRIAGAVVFIGVCVAASPMLAFVREAGGSVWMAAIFHGVFNGLGMLPLMFVQGNELLVGMQGLAGMLVFGGMSLVLFLWLGGAPPT